MKHWINEDYKDVNSTSGFMGKKWDSFVPSPEIWKEVYRVLKPGGTALVFAGTRTQDLMAISLRFAGFHIKDTLMFLFGSGFPKAADIAKNIDKKLGNEREVVGEIKAPGLAKTNVEQGEQNRSVYNFKKYSDNPASEEAAKWEGYKSHGLKPAYEPILLAMKPNDGSYADNALKHGVAGLNVDGSRVGTGGARFNGRSVDSDIYGKYGTSKPKQDYNKGRFPANIIHDGSEEVVECFPETSPAKEGIRRNRSGMGIHDSEKGTFGKGDVYGGYNDNGGSASRYFKTCPILDEDIETQRIFYTAKASKKERNAGLDGIQCVHPTVKPIKLMEYLVGLVKMPENTVVLDPFMGSGTTGIACVNNDVNFIGIELEPEYFEIAKARIEHAKEVKE
jgi:site-specific DNA-methyltransferase (adenine-specific)